ncbi:MAG: molybdate ABC transporter substrate-binding protein [Verrucomicrobiota bacterium]|nr:molybdate ABC transporter substrate-binding protein [Verrucomicrobiota bacterium]
MNNSKFIFAILLLTLLIPIFFFIENDKKNESSELVVYCAAGMRIPMEKISKDYESQYGTKVRLQFAGSGTLLGNIEASKIGDLYLAADSTYLEIAKQKELAKETIPVCSLMAGLIVRKGNPLDINNIKDLIGTENCRIVLANPEAASIGKFTKKVLSESGDWEPLAARAIVMKPTVNEVANDIKLGSADVGFAWDAIANQYPALDFVPLPQFESKAKSVTIGVLNSSTSPSAALRFARYVASKDRGQKIFAKEGYQIFKGDQWSESPEILLYTGAMLSPAIRKRIEKFESREGASIQLVPNGCGVLVSQMKAGARPDAYFSCDISFMDDVQDLFDSPTNVSSNDMIILAQNKMKGKINSLDDLTREGIRVGTAHPEKSALGALTVRLLNHLKINIEKNLLLSSATGDFLVNQLRAGSLDAVIVYRSNALANSTTLDDAFIVNIDEPMAVAIQPFAIGTNSNHKNLMMRLLDSLTGNESKSDFLKYGFKWEVKS